MNEPAWTVAIGGDGNQDIWTKPGDNVRKSIKYTKEVDLDMADQNFP